MSGLFGITEECGCEVRVGHSCPIPFGNDDVGHRDNEMSDVELVETKVDPRTVLEHRNSGGLATDDSRPRRTR